MHGFIFTGGTQAAQDGLYSLLHQQSIVVTVSFVYASVPGLV